MGSILLTGSARYLRQGLTHDMEKGGQNWRCMKYWGSKVICLIYMQAVQDTQCWVLPDVWNVGSGKSVFQFTWIIILTLYIVKTSICVFPSFGVPIVFMSGTWAWKTNTENLTKNNGCHFAKKLVFGSQNSLVHGNLWVPICQGFSHFFRFFAQFCIGQISHQQHKG